MTSNPQSISVDRIFLDLKNPRHEAYQSESEVIDYLCRNESIYALAKDITEIRLSPVESFALLPLPGSKPKGPSARFVVADGNRRLCAVKLINDPDLAPASYRRDFTRLAESSEPISHVMAVIFTDRAKADTWLERIHGGVQGGIGRKPWSSEQKTRHIGDRKNILAQTVLDYAEQQGYITPQERKGKLTTAQRYLGNTLIREAIGIDSTNSKDVSRTRPLEDVDLLVKRFTRDLVAGTVSSRANAEVIKEYSRSLGHLEGVSGARVASASLTAQSRITKSKRKAREPSKPKSINYEREIEEGLKRIGSYKLQRLYYSICDLPLEKHTPLISVGVWSFIESLTVKCGRDPSIPFTAFLSKAKLSTLGFSDRDRVRPVTETLNRLSNFGNTTKHHDTSANFNGEQLANDMDTLRGVISGLIKEIQS